MPPVPWSPKLTRGLWGVVQRAVRDGVPFHQVGAAARAAGEAPDAATIAHLYSRAVGAQTGRDREADYRARVDSGTYLARRPGGEHISPLPSGFALFGRYRQVVAVTGQDATTGRGRTLYVNVQSMRLLARGEAIEQALGFVATGSPAFLAGDLEASYEATLGPG